MKNTRKHLFAFSVVLLALMLAACGGPQLASSSLPPSELSPPPPSSEYSEPVQEIAFVIPEDGLEIFIAYEDAENLPPLGTPVEYVQNPDGYYVLIWSSSPLENISFLDWAEYVGSIGFIPGEELFATGKLEAYTPFKLKMMQYGDSNAFGVRITSESGAEYIYYINTSGKDGSVGLWEGM